MNKRIPGLKLKAETQLLKINKHALDCLFCSKTGKKKPFGKRHCNVYWKLCDTLDEIEDLIRSLEGKDE